MAQTDLTKGSVTKNLIKYAAPLVLSNVLQAAYGIVDMIVAGQYIGSAGLSGITNANTVMALLTQICYGLFLGGGILIGQYFGAKEHASCQKAARTLYSFGLAFGLMFSAAVFLACDTIVALLEAPAPAEASEYLRICALGYIFVAGYNAVSAALRAIGNSRAPLACVASTAAVNVVLDIIFVVPMGMGVFGAALATVISQAISFFVSLIFLVKARDTLGVDLLHFSMDKSVLLHELRLGLPCAVQQSMVTISWLSVTFLFNTHGIAVSAGNGVATKIKDFCQLFIVALNNAGSAMVAQNLGAGQPDRAKKTMRSAMKLSVSVSLALIVFVEFAAPWLVALFSSEAETAAMAVRNLRYEIVGQFFFAVFMMYHTLMIGSGQTWYAFWSSFINCIPVRIILAVTLNRFMAVEGLYIACMLAPAASVPFGIWYVRSGRWREKSLLRQ